MAQQRPGRSLRATLERVMKDGASGEIAVIGNECVVGIALFTGGGTSPSRAVVLGVRREGVTDAAKVLRQRAFKAEEFRLSS